MMLAGEHQIRHQQGAEQRQRRIQPPQRMSQRVNPFAPARHAEQQQTLDQHRQAHGNGTKEHRLHRMQQHRPDGFAKQRQAQQKQQAEQREQTDCDKPQPLGKHRQTRQMPGQMSDHQRQHTGAHGHGEPAGSEMTNESQRLG